MTPTQPTPEEQVEAQRIAERVVAGVDEWRAHVPEPGEGKPGGLLYGHDDFEPVARAYLALLTRQSQERAEIEKLGVKDPVLALQALRLDYEDLQAELDRAVERLELIARNAESWHHNEEALRRAMKVIAAWAQGGEIPEVLLTDLRAASPGKGAETIPPGGPTDEQITGGEWPG